MSDDKAGDAGPQAFWNSKAAKGWVEAQDLLDRLFVGFERLLAGAVEPCMRVLDVGCGTGGVTLALARATGPKGRAIGIDVSEPMIAAANDRLEQARAAGESPAAGFILDDAESHDFATASFERIVSRFGVMFFADNRRAFANLKRAAMPGAGLHAIAWRRAEENAFMTAAERAAAPLLPDLPPRTTKGPGQFAFGDTDPARRFLAESGWTGIEFTPLDLPCSLPAQGLERYVTLLGPVGRALQGADEDTRARVVERVLAAFEPFRVGEELRFTAACWMISARAGAV